MWKPLITERSGSATSKLRAAQTSVTLAPGVKEASMAGRMGVPKSFLGLVAGAVLLVVLGFLVSAAYSKNQTIRGTHAFHATKDCSGYTGLVGAYCTIRSSNVKALKVGSRIFYMQKDTKTGTDSDTVIYVGRGTVAIGHCFIANANGVGLCTISDGLGALAGFQARMRVKADAKIPNLWHWDGTYSFRSG